MYSLHTFKMRADRFCFFNWWVLILFILLSMRSNFISYYFQTPNEMKTTISFKLESIKKNSNVAADSHSLKRLMEKTCRTISVSCGYSFSILIMLDIMLCLSICKNLLYFLAIKLLNFLHYENNVRFYRAVYKKYLKEFIIFLHHYNNIPELHFMCCGDSMPFLLAVPATEDAAKEKLHLSIAYILFLFPLELWFRMWTGGAQIGLVIYIMN